MKLKHDKKRKYILQAIVLGLVLFLFLFSEALFGTWGINKTVGWAWDITNLFWWLGHILPIIGLVLIFLLIKRLIK